jgi:hypothetical protein
MPSHEETFKGRNFRPKGLYKSRSAMDITFDDTLLICMLN